MTSAHVPAGYATVNPFIVTRDAEGLIKFITEVFLGTPIPEAHTIDNDGLLLHAEVQLGDSRVMLFERKPGWPFTPAFLQIYVHDVANTLALAEERGAEVVTQPTPFYGEIFSRILDPWKNMWWVYSATVVGEGTSATPGLEDTWNTSDEHDSGAEWVPSPELTYIHDTIIEAFPRIKDPHAQ